MQPNATCTACAAKGRTVEAWRDGLCEPHYHAAQVAQRRQRSSESFWDRFRRGGRPAVNGYWAKFVKEAKQQ